MCGQHGAKHASPAPEAAPEGRENHGPPRSISGYGGVADQPIGRSYGVGPPEPPPGSARPSRRLGRVLRSRAEPGVLSPVC